MCAHFPDVFQTTPAYSSHPFRTDSTHFASYPHTLRIFPASIPHALRRQYYFRTPCTFFPIFRLHSALSTLCFSAFILFSTFLVSIYYFLHVQHSRILHVLLLYQHSSCTTFAFYIRIHTRLREQYAHLTCMSTSE